jgi:L-threonylcarbamoyladenylate synthase
MPGKTLQLVADPHDPEQSRAAIEQAAAILRGGGTVAFPTETVYGLGAHAMDASAVARIFEAKQRPAWDPLIVHIADFTALPGLAAAVPEAAHVWMQRFWPGPLTLLLEKRSEVPDAVTAGRSKVGLRIPRHPVAQALLRAAGVPVAAPSANRFGHVSPTTALHVLADLDGRIDAVLDGGPCEHGVESTVVDAASDPCVLYRPGAISLAQLAELWPRVIAYQEKDRAPGSLPEALPSPGVGIRHYAPRASLTLVESEATQATQLLQALATAMRQGTTGVLLPEGIVSVHAVPAGVMIVPWGRWKEPESMASALFAGLRKLDAMGVATIVCPLPPPQGIGAAIRDRLQKAARAK